MEPERKKKKKEMNIMASLSPAAGHKQDEDGFNPQEELPASPCIPP